jgi:hypothetical protein
MFQIKQEKLDEDFFDDDYYKKMNVLIDIMNYEIEQEFYNDKCKPILFLSENLDREEDELTFILTIIHYGEIISKKIEYKKSHVYMLEMINRLYNVTM